MAEQITHSIYEGRSKTRKSNERKSRPTSQNKQESVRTFSERMKQARFEEGLTLRELARAARVSPGTIHKIEGGRLVPSVEVFAKIMGPLRRSSSFFFGEDDEHVDLRLIRAHSAHSIKTASSVSLIHVAKRLLEPRMEAYLIKILPGGHSGKPIRTGRREIIIFVKKGTVNFWVKGERHVLREGDTFHFKATVSHRYANTGKSPAEMLAVLSIS